MSELYDFVRLDVCLPDLQAQINNSGFFDPIVCEYILVEDGDQVTVSMSAALSEAQETQLETLVDNHVCDGSGTVVTPPDPEQDEDDSGNYVVDDSSTSTDNLWTSEQTQNAINTALVDIGSGDMVSVQVRNTIGDLDIPQSFTNLPFDVTDVETNDAVLEHDTVNTNRILIKETGTYIVSYAFTCDDEIVVQVVDDQANVLPGSYKESGDPNDVNNVIVVNSNVFIATLNAGQWVSVQYCASSSAEILKAGGTFTLTRLKGPRGEKGDAGADGTGLIDISEEGSNLPGQFGKLNFVGGSVTASDAGSGVADIIITSNAIFGTQYCYAEDIDESSTTSTGWQEKVELTTGNLPAGYYLVLWSFEWRGGATSKSNMVRIDLNNAAGGNSGGQGNDDDDDDDDNYSNVYDDDAAVAFYHMEPKDTRSWYSSSGFAKLSLSGVNEIDMDYKTSNSGYSARIRRARLQLWRVQ